MAKTVHVIPDGKDWAVKREGHEATVFTTQKKAIAEARRLAKDSSSGKFVVHGVDGRIISKGVYGLPKIQQPPYKSSLGTKAIEKAVWKVVRERLT